MVLSKGLQPRLSATLLGVVYERPVRKLEKDVSSIRLQASN